MPGISRLPVKRSSIRLGSKLSPSTNVSSRSVSLNLERMIFAGNVMTTGVTTFTVISAVALGFWSQVTSSVYVPDFAAAPLTSKPSASALVLGATVYVNDSASSIGRTLILPSSAALYVSPIFNVISPGAIISLMTISTCVLI